MLFQEANSPSDKSSNNDEDSSQANTRKTSSSPTSSLKSSFTSGSIENSPIDINVGGQIYTTTLETLTRFPESRLSKMFNGTIPIVLDPSKQHYFIDRDGDSFRYILNFMRTSTLLLPDNFNDCKILLNEAKYFEIDEMIREIDQFINRQFQNNQDCSCDYPNVMASTSSSSNITSSNNIQLNRLGNKLRYQPYDLPYEKLIDDSSLSQMPKAKQTALIIRSAFRNNF